MKSRGDLAAVHTRFARAAFALYLGAAAVALALLVAVLASDLAHQEEAARSALLLHDETRTHYLSRELGLLAGELRRLGLRSEVDLLDENLAPEQSLLSLSHEKSAFFNVGVAIVDAHGQALWSLPGEFLPAGRSVAAEGWFRDIPRERDVRIVPVSPESDSDALVYLVSPVIRNGEFSGALIGGIDLARGGGLDTATRSDVDALTVLATHDGTVVYPAKAPSFAEEDGWRRIFTDRSWEPFVITTRLGGAPRVVAGGPVPGADFVLLSVAYSDALYKSARQRLRARLALALSIALVPLVVLSLLLRRNLRAFREAQESAARDERLRMLGEAANLIAHEVKNTLNGLQVGLDLVLRRTPTQPGDGKERQTVAALRSELLRLGDFTSKLLTFSKGVAPRPTPVDLASFVKKITEIAEDQAHEAGVALEVRAPEGELPIHADSALLHVVIGNLIGNAIEAQPKHVVVTVGRDEELAFVRVADDGPGVAPAVRAALFEPFVTGKPSGVGIGLALSRKIARAHGGELALEAAGPGASFLLTLPAEAVM